MTLGAYPEFFVLKILYKFYLSSFYKFLRKPRYWKHILIRKIFQPWSFSWPSAILPPYLVDIIKKGVSKRNQPSFTRFSERINSYEFPTYLHYRKFQPIKKLRELLLTEIPAFRPSCREFPGDVTSTKKPFPPDFSISRIFDSRPEFPRNRATSLFRRVPAAEKKTHIIL